jgi:hypothetical protein
MTVIEALPTLGPLLADPAFRNWIIELLLIWILVGYMPEEREQKNGEVKRVWRWGGVVRAFIQQSVETRELRSDVRTLIKKFDVYVTGNPRFADSDHPPASVSAVARISCTNE